MPPDLEARLLACLAKSPSDRPESAAALRDELLACEDAGLWTQRDASEWWQAYRGETRDSADSDSASTLGA